MTQGAGETELAYQAPAGDPGTVRAEYVAVHLATPQDGAGVLIGTIALDLLPAPQP